MSVVYVDFRRAALERERSAIRRLPAVTRLGQRWKLARLAALNRILNTEAREQ